MSFMEKFQELGGRVASQRHVAAVRDGVMLSLPATLAGSIFLILRFLPIPGYADFMLGIFGKDWTAFFAWPVAASFDLMGLIVCLGVAYYLALSYKVDALGAALTSMCSYFVLVPTFTVMKINGVADPVTVSNVWGLQYTGARSLFVILFVSLVSTEIYRRIIQRKLVITLPDMVPPNVAQNFINIVPMFAALLAMLVLRVLVSITPFGTVHELINAIITRPLLGFGSNIFGYTFLVFVKDLFWTIGIHGSNALGPVLIPIEQINLDANRMAAEAGQMIPHIITKPFRDCFIQIGGGGNTFAFTVMCAFFSKSQQMRKIGALALLPALFQINEPIIFGIPIVFNPLMMIPFLAAPAAGSLIAYFAIATGLASGFPGIQLPWTMPTFFNSYLSTGGDIRIVFLQALVIIVSALIYFPFFKMVDNQAYRQEQNLS